MAATKGQNRVRIFPNFSELLRAFPPTLSFKTECLSSDRTEDIKENSKNNVDSFQAFVVSCYSPLPTNRVRWRAN